MRLPFQSERLLFRELTLGDAPALQAMAELPGFVFVLLDPADAETGLKFARKCVAANAAPERTIYRLAIDLQAEKTLIGYIGLFHVNLTTLDAEAGFFIHPAYQRKGYAAESMAAVMEEARKTLGLTSFYATTRLDNIASQKLLAKAGMEHTGNVPNKYKDDAAERMMFRTSKK